MPSNENKTGEWVPFNAMLDPLTVLSRVTDSGSNASSSEGNTPSNLHKKNHYFYTHYLSFTTVVHKVVAVW